MIEADQISAARAFLGLDQLDLARRAHVSLPTFRRGESANGAARVSPRAVASIQDALESAGVEFIPDGVRHRQARSPEEKEALIRDIMAIAHRSATLAAENPGFTEDDLYDEFGLPA